MSSLEKQRKLSPDLSTDSIPMAVFSATLMSNIQTATSNGRGAEREELVCRLLASCMPVEEISIVLNLRKREIDMIQKNNSEIKLPEYEKQLKRRRESHFKEDIQQKG